MFHVAQRFVIEVGVFMRRGLAGVVKGAVMLVGLTLVGSTASAEDIDAIFKKVESLVQQKNYPAAISELSWAKEEIEKLHQQRLKEIVPGEVDGFKGGEPEIQSALGFTTLEREYTKGEQTITMSLSGGSGGDAMGGLAGIAKMGMMMGATQPGVEKVRLGSLTGTLDTKSSPELTVFLDSGSIVQLRTSDGVDGPALKKFAEGLKLADLDGYLKGAKG
jgi:hypothetical protein